jgi:hypothetical protein
LESLDCFLEGKVPNSTATAVTDLNAYANSVIPTPLSQRKLSWLLPNAMP